MQMTRRKFSKYISAISCLMALPFTACAAQEDGPKSNLYNCEGCDGVYERDAETLESRSVMTASSEPGISLLLKGTVFAADGETAVPDVIIYAYQTNSEGLYANGSNETPWSRRHGNIRGWVKTDAQGQYEFLTIKPAPYPNLTMPAHIHFTILESGRKPYWIDDIVFEGEFGVTDDYRAQMINQGGNGIAVLTKTDNGTWLVERNIFLEQH